MALPKEDEMLLAGLYDQATARAGSRSPALARMQSWDPAINPPPAPRTVTPAALTTPLARSTRGGPPSLTLPAGRQGGPAPLPAPQGPRPAPRPVAAQPGITHVGRAGMPTQVLQAGAGRGAAAPIPLTPPPATPLPVATKTTKTLVPATPVVTNTQVPAVKRGSSPPALDPSGQFRTLDGTAASTALSSDNLGSAVMQGRFMRPDGTRGPQETRAYTQGGIADAGKRLNVVPGLFSGVSSETEAALSAARQGAADRGDFEAVERSYMTPEQKQAARVQKAENKILRAVGGAPLSQLPQVAQAVGGIQAGGAKAALAEQGLQKGALELQQRQQIQSQLQQLSAFNDETDPGGKQRGEIMQQLQQSLYVQLAAQGKTPTQQRQFASQFKLGPQNPDTGQQSAYSYDPNTQQATALNLPGGAQPGAQAPHPLNNNAQAVAIREAVRAGTITPEQAKQQLAALVAAR